MVGLIRFGVGKSTVCVVAQDSTASIPRWDCSDSEIFRKGLGDRALPFLFFEIEQKNMILSADSLWSELPKGEMDEGFLDRRKRCGARGRIDVA